MVLHGPLGGHMPHIYTSPLRLNKVMMLIHWMTTNSQFAKVTFRINLKDWLKIYDGWNCMLWNPGPFRMECWYITWLWVPIPHWKPLHVHIFRTYITHGTSTSTWVCLLLWNDNKISKRNQRQFFLTWSLTTCIQWDIIAWMNVWYDDMQSLHRFLVLIM